MNSKENRYYVYLHRDLHGNVFYVGKGTGQRVTNKGSRSKEWESVANKGYVYQILKEGLSNREALLLEEKLITIYRKTAVNSKSSKITKELDFEELDKVFYYDSSSPSGLRWKVNRFKNKGAKLFSSGDIAGNKRYLANGTPRCWRVKFAGAVLLVHRVVWLLKHRHIDSDLVIDHLDGNAFNNCIENLKPKTHADNSRNRRNKPTNTGVAGVMERVDAAGMRSFRASWNDEHGKGQCKNFAIKKYGREEAFRMACEIRKQKIEELRKLGFDYTDRHISIQ
jgi:hypothetical protein